MTRTKSRIVAVLLSVVAVVGATVGMAAPAAATPEPTITFSWQVLIGSTWTTIPLNPAVEIPVPAGTQQSRFIITDTTAGVDAVLNDAWFGSTDYNNMGTLGLQMSSCPGYSAGSSIPLVSGVPLVCTSTYNFIAGHRAVLYGFDATFPGPSGYSFGNQGALYDGIDDSATANVQVSDGTGTFLASTDPALQALPAGYTPQVSFNFSNPSATENLTAVTYSSTGTTSLSSTCPGLAATWVPPTGSGLCVVSATKPASVTPQTITISAIGTGAFGPVTTTQSFTYAATPASCTVSATTFNPGSSGTISCTGFQPNITVTGTLHSVPVGLGSVNTGATGAFTLSFVVPKGTAAGTHTISLDSGSTALDTSDPFTVGVLAATGVDVAGALGVAGALLAIGGSLLFYRRSRSLRTH